MNNEYLVVGGGAQGRLITEILNDVASHLTVVIAPNHTDIGTDIKVGVVAIGDNHIRAKVVDYIFEKIPDFKFKYFIVHRSVLIGECVEIGSGTMIMAGAIIQNGAKIGNHCLINTRAVVEHDNKIGNFVNIQPGVVTGGYVEIGEFTQIGMGAIIRDKVKIGNNSAIGMGSVVTKDIGNYVTVWGNPAKIITK